ncbi:MAG TPA: 2-oxoacid:ferredoxin oxidoreductase subunit beta [Anaerolineae bacterium]|nr:2-oxoacid:ferredoxin oxidoreductase subunit beta [Anaerolineae bacterium]
MTMVDLKDYASPVRPTWCTGCGNYGIWNALKQALVEAGLAPHQVMLVSGIGCGSKLPDYTTANGFMSLHGRTLAIATGARLANHGMKVICTHGDGDGYSEGGNHFISTVRRNVGIVDIVQNNRVYGLTKGQYSPTSPQGFVTSTSPEGSIEPMFLPLAVAIAAGGTFVSRGWSGDTEHLAWLIKEALGHRGYALVDVLQPCVSFNRMYSYNWLRPRVYKVQDEPGYDPGDKTAALVRAQEFGDRIPLGILYRTEDEPAYEEQVPALAAGPLVQQPLRTKSAEDYESLKMEYV